MFRWVILMFRGVIATLGPSCNSAQLNYCKSKLARWATKWYDYHAIRGPPPPPPNPPPPPPKKKR
jgi:hypothetical protein